jgi:hypothetical protein
VLSSAWSSLRGGLVARDCDQDKKQTAATSGSFFPHELEGHCSHFSANALNKLSYRPTLHRQCMQIEDDWLSLSKQQDSLARTSGESEMSCRHDPNELALVLLTTEDKMFKTARKLGQNVQDRWEGWTSKSVRRHYCSSAGRAQT